MNINMMGENKPADFFFFFFFFPHKDVSSSDLLWLITLQPLLGRHRDRLKRGF